MSEKRENELGTRARLHFPTSSFSSDSRAPLSSASLQLAIQFQSPRYELEYLASKSVSEKKKKKNGISRDQTRTFRDRVRKFRSLLSILFFVLIAAHGHAPIRFYSRPSVRLCPTYFSFRNAVSLRERNWRGARVSFSFSRCFRVLALTVPIVYFRALINSAFFYPKLLEIWLNINRVAIICMHNLKCLNIINT